MRYRVLIVDDQIVSRQLFERIIRDSDRYETAASIDSAGMADAYCARQKIDLVLMDIVMKDGSDGLEAAAHIRKSYPNIRILMVTSMFDAALLKTAREAGADSFWYKEVQDRPMLEVMDRTMAGERVWPDEAPVTPIGNAASSELTEREIDVLRCLAEGLSDRECAEKLVVSVAAVRYHIGNLFEKTGFSSRTELVVAAVRSGLIIPGGKRWN